MNVESDGKSETYRAPESDSKSETYSRYSQLGWTFLRGLTVPQYRRMESTRTFRLISFLRQSDNYLSCVSDDWTRVRISTGCFDEKENEWQ